LTSWQPFLGFLGFVERETLTPRIQMRFRVVKAKSAVLFRSCFKDLYTHVFLGMSECRAQMTAYSFNQRMGSSKMGRVNEIVLSARNEISISDRIRPGRWYFLHQRGNGQTIFSDGTEISPLGFIDLWPMSAFVMMAEFGADLDWIDFVWVGALIPFPSVWKGVVFERGFSPHPLFDGEWENSHLLIPDVVKIIGH
jgi:hypothetical protein